MRRESDDRAWKGLVDLVRMLVPANAFYTRKWAAHGIDGPPESPADFRARFPLTTKQELVEDQLASPPFGTNLTYPLAHYTRFHQTSGTTGVPLRWLDTPESWSWMVENWGRVFQAAGVGRDDRVFFAFSFGPFLGFWTAFQAAERLGCLCLPGGGMSTEARLRTILNNGATVLCCTPTYALHLGETARTMGLDLSACGVRLIIGAGEPGAGVVSTRARIEALWGGAAVRDHHGMTETGPVTYECPMRPFVLHVLEPQYIPEVVEPTGAPVGPGTSGELVLTNLGRVGSPLVRYRTGDLVRPVRGPCPCGSREMALEGGILGRVDDMVVVRGVNLYPSAVEEVVRGFAEVVEYRVDVRTQGFLSEVTLEIETHPDVNPNAVCRAVEVGLRTAFNLRVPVRPAAPGALPRFEMKAQRWVRTDT